MFSNADAPEEILRLAGQRLAEQRLSMRITQAELAARAGISKRTVERLERGETGARMDAFIRICLTLGLADGFNRLLPPHEIGPIALARGETLPRRVRKHRQPNKGLWKDAPQ